MSENYGTSQLLIEPRPPVDAVLFDELRAIPGVGLALFDALKLPKAERDNLYADFQASGYQDSPDLRPRSIDEAMLETGDEQLTTFKQRLKDVEDPIIAEAYGWKVNELLASNRMLRASFAGDMKRYDAYNVFIYGHPDPDVTGGVADFYKQMAVVASANGSYHVKQAADEVTEALDGLRGDRSILAPDPEVFQAIRERYVGKDGHFEKVLNGQKLPKTGKIGNKIGDPILRAAMDSIDLQHYEIVDSVGTAWSWAHGDTAFKRPKSYDISQERYQGLVLGHEFGHGLELANGTRSGLKLAGWGLDRVEIMNEGSGVIPEQVAYPDFVAFTGLMRWHTIMRRQLAVALGAGFDGNRRSFSEVYRIIGAIDRLQVRQSEPDDSETADKKAALRTWNLLSGDTQKGTDGQGGAAYRYKTYLEGNIALWRAEESHPGITQLSYRMKADILNPRHVRIGQHLGIYAGTSLETRESI